MSNNFVPGWFPEVALTAQDSIFSNGGYDSAIFEDDSDLPEAMSLSFLTKWNFDQGPVGSCFSNNTAQAFQILTAGENLEYPKWEEHKLSRAIIWYEGRKRDGLLGYGQDGGSITNAVLSMTDKGSGVCKDSFKPYKADRNYLEQKPSEDSYLDAKMNQVTKIASVGPDEWMRCIKNMTPIAIGIWWPYGWSTKIGPDGRAKSIGSGTFGHAVTVIGYHKNWDGHTYWQIENSHGAIYSPVPKDVASEIKGYVAFSENHPDKVFNFWVRDDMLRDVINKGNSEMIAVAGMDGFTTKSLPWSRVL